MATPVVVINVPAGRALHKFEWQPRPEQKT